MNSRCRTKPSLPVSLQPDIAMIANLDDLSAAEIAHSVAVGKMSALSATEAALARIARHDPALNSFTDVTAERARAKARAVDAVIASGQNAGPLAGVPFAVKNLFDVQGLPTRAGSKINRDLKPSARDATLIERMEAAGAVLVGALNMGEYAYDFTGENVHDGPSRNPHDVTRMTGGSSGGSGGAVGGGLVPLAQDIGGLRIAIAGGYFQNNVFPEAVEAVARVAKALGTTRVVEIPEAARARAAAYVIYTIEGASLHLDRLRKRPDDFDPAVRDRLLAGAMIPAPLVDRAQKFRRWYRAQMLEIFRSVDVIIAPATPCVAPKLGQATFVLDGVELPVRANIGIHTQPISFIGLPVVAVPVPLQPMPIGVQIIAAPWREDIALRVAFALERAGVVAAPPPRGL